MDIYNNQNFLMIILNTLHIKYLFIWIYYNILILKILLKKFIIWNINYIIEFKILIFYSNIYLVIIQLFHLINLKNLLILLLLPQLALYRVLLRLDRNQCFHWNSLMIFTCISQCIKLYFSVFYIPNFFVLAYFNYLLKILILIF